MEQNDTLLGTIEPEIMDRLVTRREAIRKGASVSSVVAAGLAMGSIPVALAALSREAYGQASLSVQDVINFALMLEIFEFEFYSAVLGVSSSAAQSNAFAPVRASVPASALPALNQIRKHEQSHIAFLTANGAVNVLNLSANSFDFTGNRGSGTPGPFAPATTDLQFLLAVAQGAEDTGVRAYKGQAGNLQSNTVVLEAALRIHSVEARHASKIRRIRRQNGATNVKFSGTITGGGAGAAGAGNVNSAYLTPGVLAAFGAIYGGEDNTTQSTVNVTTLAPTGVDATAAATEAFDEPLAKSDVVGIVQGFFIPTIP